MGIYSGPSLNNGIYELARFVFRGANTPPTFNMFPGAAQQSGGNSTSFNFTPTVGVWYNFMGTVNNTTWTIYLNGVFQVSSDTTGTTSNITSFNPSVHVGVSLYGGGTIGLAGLVDDTRLYTTALSAPQIFGIYQSQGIPPRLTLTGATGGLPSPTYAWPFQNSVIDAVQGVYPASANVAGVNWNTWLSGNTWPYYDSTAPVYGTNSIIFNSINSAYSNGISYTINSPFGGSSSFAVCFWIKPIQTILNAYGYYLRIQSTVGNFNLWLNSSYNPNYSVNGSLAFINNGFPSSTASLNKWTHIAVSIVNTSSNITSQFFTNGVGGVVSTGLPLLPQSNVFTVLNVGFNNGGAGEWELGAEFGDLRIYNTALSPAQIQTIYQSGGNLYGANLVQPNYLWTFEGNLNEQVTGLSSTRGVNISYGPGKYGQGLASGGMSFYGGDSPVVPKLPLLSYSGGLTVAIWVYYTSSASGYLFDIATFNSAVTLKFNDRIYGGTNPVSVSTQATSGGFSFNFTNIQNSWNHYVFSFNSTSFSFYLNGSLVGTRATPSTWGTADDVTYFGGNISTGMLTTQSTSSASGTTIDDFRVYNTALSAQQIQGIYLSGGARPSGVLTSG